MQNITTTYKDKTLSEEDPILSLPKRICIVKTIDNSFAARLIKINGDELWFQNRRGQKWMVNRKNILEIKPLDRVV